MARHISAGCRCAQSDIGGSIHNLYPKTYPNLPLQIPLTGLYLFIHASLFRVKIVANIRLNLLICTHFALIQRRLVIRIPQGVPDEWSPANKSQALKWKNFEWAKKGTTN